jgi:hypothetical protein
MDLEAAVVVEEVTNLQTAEALLVVALAVVMLEVLVQLQTLVVVVAALEWHQPLVALVVQVIVSLRIGVNCGITLCIY